jgi:hypothetical protein
MFIYPDMDYNPCKFNELCVFQVIDLQGFGIQAEAVKHVQSMDGLLSRRLLP